MQNTVGDSELIIAYLKAVYPDLTSRVPSMETGPPLATAAAARCCAEAEVQLHPRSCGPVPPLLISADPAIRRKVAEDSLYFHLLFEIRTKLLNLIFTSITNLGKIYKLLR